MVSFKGSKRGEDSGEIEQEGSRIGGGAREKSGEASRMVGRERQMAGSEDGEVAAFEYDFFFKKNIVIN